MAETNGFRHFLSRAAGIDVKIDLADQRESTADWRERWPDFDELSKPRSFNFHWLGRADSMLIIRGVLKHWSPRPTVVAQAHVGLLDELGLTVTAQPLAIEVDNVDYAWRNGRIDR